MGEGTAIRMNFWFSLSFSSFSMRITMADKGYGSQSD